MKTLKTTEHFDNWMARLRDRAGVARIRIRLDRLALGNPGQMRNFKGGVSEMKIDFGPGYRVYFTERGGEIIVLLCGGDKSSQDADIALATRLAKEV
jgi:putative addiction module killer protein